MINDFTDYLENVNENFLKSSPESELTLAEQIIDHSMSINGNLTWINHVVSELNTTISDFKSYSDDVLMAEKLTKYANILNDRSKNILAHSNKIQDLTENI